MVPILYMSHHSPPVRAVLMTVEAIGKELDLKEVNFTSGDHLNLEFLKVMYTSLFTSKEKSSVSELNRYRRLRVAKKLHNLFVIKDINFFFFLDDSYASTTYSENIAVYIQVSRYYKNTKVMFFDFIFGFYAKL
jgi:hypothetical protein